MSTNKDIMEAAERLKDLLVRNQQYEHGKVVRDIERAYLEKVHAEPVTGERVYTAEQQLINVGNAVKCIEEGQELLEQRLEKLEKYSGTFAEISGTIHFASILNARIEKLEKALSEPTFGVEHNSAYP
jgi:ubiquinone biosynthesis protein UbiJ